MTNPFDSLKDRLDDIRRDVEHAVHVAILRELAVALLSRLATLDTPNAAKYQAAINAVQGD